MKIEQAIYVIIHERECVTRASTEGCDRNCGECDLLLNDNEIREAYDMALSAFKKLADIESIISSPLYIQEDVIRYKAICEVINK